MTVENILNQEWTKTKKSKALYDLGLTRREVANLVCNGNYGFAYNIWKSWSQQNEPVSTQQIIEYLSEFSFNRKFGVEIEFFKTTESVLTQNMNQSGLNFNFEQYNHITRESWKFITDSSISGDEGHELVSPPLQGKEGLKSLRKACKALRLSKAKINKSCGLHVHIDVNDFSLTDFKLLINNWIEIEKEIDQIMPKSRRKNNNEYCKSNIISNLNSKINNIRNLSEVSEIFETRYMKMNFKSYQKYGTVEFRHHGGSCNYTKIKNWILICSRLIEATKQGISIKNIKQILNDDLQEYFEERKLDFIQNN